MHIDADSLIEHDASLNIESINPCSALSGIEKPRFTMSVVVIGLCCVIKFKDRTTPFRVFLNQYDKFQAYLTQ